MTTNRKEADFIGPSPEATSTDVVEVVPQVGDVVNLVDPSAFTSGPRAATWNGVKTRVTLGHGIIHNHEFKGDGDTVEFSCAWQEGASRDPKSGAMVAGWVGPESETFVRLFAAGFFLGTDAYRQRQSKQVNVNAERGIDRPDLPDDPRPQGLEALTSDEQRQRVADMLRGGVVEMKRKEAQEARTATDEASERIAAALEKVLEKRVTG